MNQNPEQQTLSFEDPEEETSGKVLLNSIVTLVVGFYFSSKEK